MPKRRFQNGNIRTVHGSYVGRYYDEDGIRQQVNLGRVSKVKKSEARRQLAEILSPINATMGSMKPNYTFEDFVRQVFSPRKRRKWKVSTAMTTEDRIQTHLMPVFGPRAMRDITDDELQAFLDGKADLSFSTVDHLKWDLVAIFRMALAKRCITWNPAAPEMLETPKECKKKPNVRFATEEEVPQIFELIETFELRERCIMKLALIAGMRPGEIFGLKRGDVTTVSAQISRRIYRGDVDTPKTGRPRNAALAAGLAADLWKWLHLSGDTGPDGWLFPSENLKTPLWRENVLERYIRPKLKREGFEWVNFQVLRRTHASLMSANEVPPKVSADQLGHTVDVNQNEYTQTPLEQKRKAVEALESALIN